MTSSLTVKSQTLTKAMQKPEAGAFKKQCQKLHVLQQTSQAMTRSDLWKIMQGLWWRILLSEYLQRASVRVHTLHEQKHTSNFTGNLCIIDTMQGDEA